MDIFLLLTAMLCGLTSASRPADLRAPTVEASRSVAIAAAVAPAALRAAAAARPDGDVALEPMVLDLAMLRDVSLKITPERRRE